MTSKSERQRQSSDKLRSTIAQRGSQRQAQRQAAERLKIVSEIEGIRKSMAASVGRMHELSRNLYHQVRKSTLDNDTETYLKYANTWMHFAGAMDHGIRRSAQTSKAIKQLDTSENRDRDPRSRDIANKIDRLKASADISPTEALYSAHDESDEVVPYRDRDRAPSHDGSDDEYDEDDE